MKEEKQDLLGHDRAEGGLNVSQKELDLISTKEYKHRVLEKKWSKNLFCSLKTTLLLYLAAFHSIIVIQVLANRQFNFMVDYLSYQEIQLIRQKKILTA